MLESLLALSSHEILSKRALRLLLVVPNTSQAEVFQGRLTPSGDRHDVIDVKMLAGSAPASGNADEGAASLVPLPHRAPYRRRDVSGRPIGGHHRTIQMTSAGAEPSHFD